MNDVNKALGVDLFWPRDGIPTCATCPFFVLSTARLMAECARDPVRALASETMWCGSHPAHRAKVEIHQAGIAQQILSGMNASASKIIVPQ